MKNTALITGASSGMGKEFAKIHASKGNDLVIVARRKEKLEELKAELQKKFNVKVKIIAKDLSKPEAASEVFNEIKKEKINIEYLINNAGFGGRGKFHEREWQKDLDMINLNVVALSTLTRLFLPEMVKRNKGKILNVSSTASLMPGPLQAVYYATKAYVTSFSNALAQELHDTNITVTALLPGATETEFAQTSGMDKTRLFDSTFSAEVVAKDGYDAMEKGKLNILAGVSGSQKVMMKMAPLMPKKTMLKMIYNMQKAE